MLVQRIPSDAIYYPAVSSLGCLNLHLFCQCRLAFSSKCGNSERDEVLHGELGVCIWLYHLRWTGET
jgi:hypothetical protein